MLYKAWVLIGAALLIEKRDPELSEHLVRAAIIVLLNR